MKNTTRFLPGFHLSTLRRKPKTAVQKLTEKIAKIKKHSISQLGEFFNGFIVSCPIQYFDEIEPLVSFRLKNIVDNRETKQDE